MRVVRVGVVDVGANTARLLVAEQTANGLLRVAEERVPLGLGAEVEGGGEISSGKLAEVEEAAHQLVGTARTARAERIDVLVTSPGRQAANGHDLAAAIRSGCGLHARVLSADDEARLAFAGALSAAMPTAETVAVCDVGGGSAQLAVGSPEGGPAWIRSIDVGSLRLTRRYLGGDPPSAAELRRAESAVAEALEHLTPPLPRAALAVGGTARALRKVVGPSLGSAELTEALRVVTDRRSKQLSSEYGIARWRAEVLPGGVVLMIALQQLLAVPLKVVRGGLREGAALALLEQAEAAA
jgi:exopolyphosphatase/guanosine-5'-triphosphate,3'-diphosphate pyrophosphatase